VCGNSVWPPEKNDGNNNNELCDKAPSKQGRKEIPSRKKSCGEEKKNTTKDKLFQLISEEKFLDRSANGSNFKLRREVRRISVFVGTIFFCFCVLSHSAQNF
jgi:hypothetical protein